MSTSLADQLQRLVAPQTEILKDSKKRPSILFDPLDAATKDRETIYDIGLSGLEDLVDINPSFATFASTLFDRTSIRMERAVESNEVNLALDKTIHSFFLHISPYFLLQPAHKCLEWLIRRYHIHRFNRDKFVMLIMPYHETNIFVRCVQLLDMNNKKDMWYWLLPIHKNGTRLAKQTIFNQAATNPSLIDLISQTVLEGVKTLGVKASTLQAFFGFYVATIIGVLESTQLTERLLIKILPTVLKGLVSEVIDLTAASYMITAELVSKFKFEAKILDSFIKKISSVAHNGLNIDAIMLLILIYKTQSDSLKNRISDIALDNIINHSWFSVMLSQVASQGVEVISLYIPILTSCLKRVQLKSKNWIESKNLLESLIIDVTFNEKDGEIIIRHVLESYVLSENQEVSITIDSDDDNVIDSCEKNNDMTLWFPEFLQKLERQYPESFDTVIKKTMKETNFREKTALKAVLKFVLKCTYTKDNANLFENLYHHQPMQRVIAVKYLVNNFSKMNLNTDDNNLFKESIMERLTDDHPDVVNQMLKFKAYDLLDLIGVKELIEQLTIILQRCLQNQSLWSNVVSNVIKLITSNGVCKKEYNNSILLAIFPFFFPTNQSEVNYLYLILNSEFVKFNIFLKKCKQLIKKKSHKEIIEIMNKCLMDKNHLPEFNSLIETIQGTSSKQGTSSSINIFYNILLLAHTLPNKCKPNLSQQFFNLTVKYFDENDFQLNDNELNLAHTDIRNNKMSVQIYLFAIKSLLEYTDFSDYFDNDSSNADFSNQSDTLTLIISIYQTLLIKSVTENKLKNIFNLGLSDFFKQLFPNFIDKVQFLSNFCVKNSTNIKTNLTVITPELQLRSIKLLNEILTKSLIKSDIPFEIIIKILFGLTSEITVIRESTIHLIQTISTITELNENMCIFLKKLLLHKEELKMDHEQVALIIFTILSPDKTVQRKFSTKENKAFTFILKKLIEIVSTNITHHYISAGILELIKHINNREILSKVTNCSISIYDLIKETKENILNSYEGYIIRNILYRYDKDTIKTITTSESSWNTIKYSLKNYNLLMPFDGKLISPALIFLNILDKDLFNVISDEYKKELIRLIIDVKTYSENNELALATSKTMKKIELDVNLILNVFISMKNCSVPAPQQAIGGSLRNSFTPSIELLNNEEWKCGLTLLEFIQNKKRLDNSHILIAPLFDLLKLCLDFEEQSSVEYAKQIILSCILHCCQKLSPDGTAKRNIVSDNVFRIDLIVQCIRTTQNPQTHHHALLLLCHTAAMIPEQVLHNMMDIFTFMGSSVLRHDDAYSFQIIIKIIETVIPILVKSNENIENSKREQLVMPVLKVFSDIILDVPDHRRSFLYLKLLQTINPEKYLWMFFAILFESHVVRYQKENKPNVTTVKDDELGKRVEYALAICKEFEPSVAIKACTQLMEYLRQLPMDEINDKRITKKFDIDITDENIFIVEAHSTKELRHFKYVILQFINALTSSPQFINKIVSFNDNEIKEMKVYYFNIIINILMYIAEISKNSENNNENRYWKIMLNYCYDILDNAISQLSIDNFISVVEGLLKHKLFIVRKKVIELLNNNLQNNSNFEEKCEKKKLILLIYPLQDIINIIDTENNNENIIAENTLILQSALISIKLLSKILAHRYPDDFKKCLKIIMNISKIKCYDLTGPVMASVILCMAEIGTNLQVHVLSDLPEFMEILMKILKKQCKLINPTEPICIATLSAIHRIVETIPAFLSPYLFNILKYITQISIKLKSMNITKQSDVTLQMALNKLNDIYEKLATYSSGRVLLPVIQEVYEYLLNKLKFKAIQSLMELTLAVINYLSIDEFHNLQNDLSNFFLKALQLRSHINDQIDINDLEKVNNVELSIINTFVILILKLSESTFQPLYYKIYDWAIRNDVNCKNRAITFYCLTYHIAKSLKSIFTCFLNLFIDNSAQLLTECIVEDKEITKEICQNVYLIENILNTLYNICLYDNQNYVSAKRFNIIMQPMVNQIDNEIVFKNQNLKTILTTSLAELAVTIFDDRCVKKLNYEILFKSRNINPEIKLFALHVCTEMAKKLGESFLPFLPETIPFLSELLEDENSIVEKSCQRSLQVLSTALGEPLQKYF